MHHIAWSVLWLFLAAGQVAAAEPTLAQRKALATALAEARSGDFAAALELWAPLAESGVAEAQYNLALLHERGAGVPSDPEQAMWWYLKAAQQKHAYAVYNLAAMFRDGRGVRPDPVEAARRYREAADLGVPEAAWWLSRQSMGQGDAHQAYYWAYRGAVLGDAAAMAEVARCLADGHGVTADRRAAAAWANKAAASRHPKALVVLARSLAEGWGAPTVDAAQAVAILREAAEAGDVEAERRLGQAYASAKGVQLDYGQAVFWFTRAARQGDAEAQYLLALAFRLGRGHPASLANAWAWCTLAAEQGHTEAAAALKLLDEDLLATPAERRSAEAVLLELRRGLVRSP